MWEVIWYILIILLGASFGSFYNVCAYRIPNNENVIKGRSYCENCNTSLKGYELIPIIGYISIKGRCKYCNTPIGLKHLIVELLSGLYFALLYFKFGFNFQKLIIGFTLFTFLSIIGIMDFNYHKIHKKILNTLLILSIIYRFIYRTPLIFDPSNILKNDVVLFFILVVVIFSLQFLWLLNQNNIKESYIKDMIDHYIGIGDLKLMVVMLLILNAKLAIDILIIINLSIILIYTISYIKNKNKNKDYLKIGIPLGSFISIGILVGYLM